ncbi:MAG: lipocalin-like domain-containing protein [Pseudomonadota bacterium]
MRLPAGLLAALALALGGCAEAPSETATDPLGFLQGDDVDGFERAVSPREFVFPADHAAHPDFRSEWWYFTGNLAAGDRELGFQLTIFRFALAPIAPDPRTGWETRQVWLGQLAVSDLEADRFLQAERVSRGAPGLAGSAAATLDVFVEDWRISGKDLTDLQLVAADRDFGIDLTLTAARPIVLQGERGLSRKGPTPGNASYYYSVPRLAATGTVRLPDEILAVEGTAWFDREWSTSALETDQAGWDWFALQLDDGTDAMVYRLRTLDGQMHDFSAGVIIDPAGQVQHFAADALRLVPRREWRSDATRRRYPVDWTVRFGDLELAVTARRDRQEHVGRFEYWEGAVEVEGTRAGRPLSGVGYLEMTGYE